MARIRPFKNHEENFECYTERLEAYFTANGVSADKQASVLISEMGAETYTLLKSLIPAPAKPKDKTYRLLMRTSYTLVRALYAKTIDHCGTF